MRVAVLACAAVSLLVTAGCSNNPYYQTRYVPTSSEESFSAGERLFWTEDARVYDLPSRPPALATNDVGDDDNHRQRIDCAAPGVKFKSERVATGNGTAIKGKSKVDGLVVASMRDDQAGVSPRPDHTLAIGGWRAEPEQGAQDDRAQYRVAGYDTRPLPVRGEGIDRIPVNPVVSTRDDADWCPPKR